MQSLSKRDLSILIGNSLDHFDTSLYSFLVPILGPIFFPEADYTVQMILAYSVLATSTITKPLGAIIFGKIAIKYGPILGLSYSLISVAITTVAIGCIPTHANIGYFAPLTLLLFRMLKGIFAAGEGAIAKLCIVEGKSADAAFKASYLYQTSTMAGIVAASAAGWIVLGLHQAYQDLWRACFLLGGVTGIFGYYLRKYSSSENLAEKKILPDYDHPYSLNLLLANRKNILKVATTTLFSYMTHSVPFIVMNSLIPLITAVSLKTMMALNTSLLVLDMLLIPFLGKLVRNYSPTLILLASCGALSVTIIPVWSALHNASLLYITLVRSWIVICGVLFMCPLNLWYKKLVDSPDQYLQVGIGNAIGAGLGRLIPAACMALWHFTNTHISIAVFIAAISLFTIWTIK